MLNFELYNPTNYIFGKDQIEKLSTLVPKNAKILLAYGGGSIFKNGIHEEVIKNLKGFDVIEFGGIEPNPRFETLMTAVEIIRKEKINFILAVGGGSVIDGVKFISGATNFEGNPIDILKNRVLFTDLSKVIPFGTVLTLPATGSEMNSGAVVTIEATQEKLVLGGSALFPKFSICDPTVIASLPKRQLENGVVDAFTHVMEQYLTYPHDAILQDRIAESILQTLVEIGPNVVKNPTDYKLASNFMWCATMALNGLIQKGVPSDWATHMIGHELTALYGIDHARTLAVIAPSLYKAMFETKKDKLAQYGERIFNITGNSTEEKAAKAIEKTVDFFHKMGMQTKLSEYTEDYKKSADFIVNRFETRGWKALGEKQNITLQKVKEIVEGSY
ncbi:iron-containing alcohol dehydrogenase [Flavobacterium psychrophilum]|uniref:iron-containing alcohol dehydrogenase n=1 Tax=Flavobacterium psychrophilum TaxID=96345 RepID=UPI001C8F99FB|nr:iron-containing alcohol dehydrogenase [Flavobacterium psychrophilum]EKT4499914.1 iron-containing alcohol dehydrogenase [Flavobacterium psychrophilum]ELM3651449.1 iron-containing alcohol dehydrogenase [Flavobacterium psychrophilum]ELM3672489.1 iron-containing alcohol dehydrogenase [Flavobacterium psychrophilum]ELY1992689.1 iron-containing alcohol dehydrogenase [Flavobacterium psychrophilum]MCB6061874.1 iron-containing alcohol dehydrogenase [Flavobacterium psychrophilum]